MFLLGVLIFLALVFWSIYFGRLLIESGLRQEERIRALEETSPQRMTEYSAWLNGSKAKGPVRPISRIKFDSGCVDDEHTPVVLFNQENPRKVDAVICSVCTDTLPKPATFSCDDCWVIAVDGYLHVNACSKHEKESVPA